MKPMHHLQPLRKRLARLCRRRRRFRRATAASGLAIAVLWALAGVFALDWYFQRNVDLWQRLFLLILAAGGVVYAFSRFVRPWLGQREDVTDMALLVQRQAGIDSDVVAALQFESSDASQWGSPQLETAVIDRVAARQRNIDVMASVPHEPLAWRLKVLAATAVVWAALGVLAPQHVLVFFRRLALGAEHYPTRTQVQTITVNGKNVDLSAGGEAAVHVPCGQTVHFEVAAVGGLPASDADRVELSTQGRSLTANIPLKLAHGDDDAGQVKYRGEFVGLAQSALFQVYVGDTWTDPFMLSVTPLPDVEIQAEVVPPAYARQSTDQPQKNLPRGRRQFSVLSGSQVRLTLDSDRPLQSAEATLAGKAHHMQPAGKSAAGKELWTLATDGTPLASVAQEVPFSIQVRDPEGQTLDQPLKGIVSIEPDQPPGITATTKTTLVLTTGSPNIEYKAADDHALGCIWLTWEAVAGDADVQPAATNGASAGNAAPADRREGRIEIDRFSLDAGLRSQEGNYALPLRSLPLKPGDTLKVTFHVSDYRGPAPAETVDADPPLVFQVTDLPGFLSSMYDSDQKSAGALEDLRKKHSGLGESQ
jgi:hypothetical protein